jgi:hypothetical protein
MKRSDIDREPAIHEHPSVIVALHANRRRDRRVMDQRELQLTREVEIVPVWGRKPTPLRTARILP